MRFASSLILLTNGGEIILQKRDSKEGIFYPGCWGLIGGAALINEDARQCIERECYEETGWIPKSLRMLFFVNEHCYETVFFSRISSIEQLACNEGESLHAFHLEELTGLCISEYHRGIIEKFEKEYWSDCINNRGLSILFYSKLMPPGLGGYVSAGGNLSRILMQVGETTIVTDNTLSDIKEEYDLLFFNATYENSEVFDFLRKKCKKIWTYEHNLINEHNYIEMRDRFNKSDKILVPSDFLREKMHESELFPEQIEVFVLPISIDINHFTYKSVDSDSFKFVTVCAYKEIRNILYNMNVIKCLVDLGIDCTYDIYGMIPFMGDNGYLRKLLNHIYEQGLENVITIRDELIGMDTINDTLHKYNYYIDFSLHETFGQAKIEAIASGLNIIMSSIDNNQYLLPPQSVFYDGTEEYVANKILDKYKEGKTFTEILRVIARQYLIQKYSDSAVLEKFYEYYE